jgi:hypothetical protein
LTTATRVSTLRSMATRRRIADSMLFVFALVAGAALFSNQVRQNDSPQWAAVLGTLAGVAACGALWLRRRWPVGVAAAILPAAALTSFAAPAGLIAFFTVAVQRRLAVVRWLDAIAPINSSPGSPTANTTSCSQSPKANPTPKSAPNCS